MTHNTHPKITVTVNSDSSKPPEYKSFLASGCDLHAKVQDPVTLESLERKLIPTGLYLDIPPGFEAQIRPRSGQAYKKGLSMPNSPGTIDADYRGEIKVLVINLSPKAIVIEPDERIAQMVFAPVVQANFIVQSNGLSQTSRQSGGFGSTGV